MIAPPLSYGGYHITCRFVVVEAAERRSLERRLRLHRRRLRRVESVSHFRARRALVVDRLDRHRVVAAGGQPADCRLLGGGGDVLRDARGRLHVARGHLVRFDGRAVARRPLPGHLQRVGRLAADLEVADGVGRRRLRQREHNIGIGRAEVVRVLGAHLEAVPGRRRDRREHGVVDRRRAGGGARAVPLERNEGDGVAAARGADEERELEADHPLLDDALVHVPRDVERARRLVAHRDVLRRARRERLDRRHLERCAPRPDREAFAGPAGCDDAVDEGVLEAGVAIGHPVDGRRAPGVGVGGDRQLGRLVVELDLVVQQVVAARVRQLLQLDLDVRDVEQQQLRRRRRARHVAQRRVRPLDGVRARAERVDRGDGEGVARAREGGRQRELRRRRAVGELGDRLDAAVDAERVRGDRHAVVVRRRPRDAQRRLRRQPGERLHPDRLVAGERHVGRRHRLGEEGRLRQARAVLRLDRHRVVAPLRQLDFLLGRVGGGVERLAPAVHFARRHDVLRQRLAVRRRRRPRDEQRVVRSGGRRARERRLHVDRRHIDLVGLRRDRRDGDARARHRRPERVLRLQTHVVRGGRREAAHRVRAAGAARVLHRDDQVGGDGARRVEQPVVDQPLRAVARRHPPREREPARADRAVDGLDVERRVGEHDGAALHQQHVAPRPVAERRLRAHLERVRDVEAAVVHRVLERRRADELDRLVGRRRLGRPAQLVRRHRRAARERRRLAHADDDRRRVERHHHRRRRGSSATEPPGSAR